MLGGAKCFNLFPTPRASHGQKLEGMEMLNIEKAWKARLTHDFEVVDWDGGNPESDAPKLTGWESVVVGALIIGALLLCIPVVFYDWIQGGGRRS